MTSTTSEQSTPIWIKSATLATALTSPVKTQSRRRLPIQFPEEESSLKKRGRVGPSGALQKEKIKIGVWGWTRACILSSRGAALIETTNHQHPPHHNAAAVAASGGEYTNSTPLKKQHNQGSLTILVTDDQSEFNAMTVELNGNIQKGAILFDNKFRLDADVPNDLIQLTHLHEPAVVWSLKRRYSMDMIYTATGPILLALNPFKNCHQMYSQAVMSHYWSHGQLSFDSINDENENDMEELPPHVYRTADNAYRSMMRILEDNLCKKAQDPVLVSPDQSILVSGESGAGKTVTTKFIMKYLATLSQRSSTSLTFSTSTHGSDGSVYSNIPPTSPRHDARVEQQVLESNPILESFGNARTIRNDNSSRFGKFIEIQFSNSGRLIGASIETYLLEKVRLIQQSCGERNFHIFYEVLEGARESDKRPLLIENMFPDDFQMTCNSGTFHRRDGVSDTETYSELLHAMNTMGFEKSEQTNILRVVCALLHLSNLTFNELDHDGSKLDFSNPSIEPTVQLLGVSAEDLNRSLCSCEIVAAGESVTKVLSWQQAYKATEALSKATYNALFSYLVKRINGCITVKNTDGVDSNNRASFIGVLDIFGFESFEKNSFEQLCINYCNEGLQQQFNRFVFKMEQEEYEREGIEWSFITFPDNQDVLDLIDKKHEGILPILDEQCRLGSSTDESFANAIIKRCASHPRFSASSKQKVNGIFAIKHYAGEVEYTSASFLEKNKDELPKEASNLLASSTNAFLAELGQALSNNDNTDARKSKQRGRSSLHKVTVGNQFNSQLVELRARLDKTSPHYIRCLKPNEDLIPNHYDPSVIADQLKCNGILEAIRVSRVGYPQRYTHERFVDRYELLGRKELKLAQKSQKCSVLVNTLAENLSGWSGGTAAKRSLNNHSSHKVQNTWNPMGSRISSFSKSAVDLASVGIQMGKTKVFLRQKSFDALEQMLTQWKSGAVTQIQALCRRYLQRKRFIKKLWESNNAKQLALQRKIEEQRAERERLRVIEEEKQRRKEEFLRNIADAQRQKKNTKKDRSPQKFIWKREGSNWFKSDYHPSNRFS